MSVRVPQVQKLDSCWMAIRVSRIQKNVNITYDKDTIAVVIPNRKQK
jgi:hypothetical protein